jgi:hypothetical protein
MFRAATGGFDDGGLGDGFGCVGFDDGRLCFGRDGDVRGVAGLDTRVAIRAEDVDRGEQAASITRRSIAVLIRTPLLTVTSLRVSTILGG